MRQVYFIVMLLSVLVLLGTVGFMVLEGWDFFDSFYMAVTTITTVGYQEVHPLSRGGRAFVIGYLVVGLGIFFYGVVQIGELVVRTEFGNWWEKRRMDKTIKAMQGHQIICGSGRMGRVVCRQLAREELPFVVIDRDDSALDEARRDGWHWIHGDATDDRVLIEAGVERAHGLATVLPSDADNVFIVLSARLLSKKLQIIARASDEKGVVKLERAGADRVVSPYATGAAKVSHFLIHPNVEQFLEVITKEGRELDLSEVTITTASPYAGRRLAQTDFSSRGIIIVGIRRSTGELLFPPPSTSTIEAGDHLIALGKVQAVAELSRIA